MDVLSHQSLLLPSGPVAVATGARAGVTRAGSQGEGDEET
jgi:hypothetical protein